MAVASIILKVINETASRKSEGSGWGMWVMEYYDPETRKPTSVKVVCGEYYPDKDSGERRYKAKGWGKKDFDALRGSYPQIENWFNNPPPIPEDGGAKPPAAGGLEPAPF